jgi:hypothetical protein
LERAGFRVEALNTVFQGQHLWIEASLGGPRTAAPTHGRQPQVAVLSVRERNYASAWRDRLQGLKPHGGIAVWGAGAKGVTFATLVDRDAHLIDCLIDVNPGKQDLFIPVSAHRVLSPAAALASGLATIVVMNPNYRMEIEAELDRHGAAVRMLDA